MTEAWSGKLAVDIRDAEPDWGPFEQPKASSGAPNVLLLAWDGVGYGAWDVSGGPIEVPTMRRIRDLGLQYSNFHTTALCSPTRASLLTGRNGASASRGEVSRLASARVRGRSHWVRPMPGDRSRTARRGA